MNFGLMQIVFLSALFITCPAARAADKLECMDGQFGEVERLAMNRKSDLHRPDEQLDNAVQEIIGARGRVCKYFNNWSDRALKTAVLYRQWQIISDLFEKEYFLSQEEQARLDAALEPKRSQYLALFAPSVDAQQRGANGPPPQIDMFRDFDFIIRKANIPETPKTKQAVEAWLYVHGMLEALASAFASE